MELYNVFEKENHLQPAFDKAIFEVLHGWKFGWEILKPLNIANGKEEEKLLAKRLSPGQKALYFIWYLDAQVTNGGFIQFYWNGYRMYLPAIIDGLKLIEDISMLNLVNNADEEYQRHKDKFTQVDDSESLYDELIIFDELDSQYYKIHNDTMALIEKYIRLHFDEFIKLTNS